MLFNAVNPETGEVRNTNRVGVGPRESIPLQILFCFASFQILLVGVVEGPLLLNYRAKGWTQRPWA